MTTLRTGDMASVLDPLQDSSPCDQQLVTRTTTTETVHADCTSTQSDIYEGDADFNSFSEHAKLTEKELKEPSVSTEDFSKSSGESASGDHNNHGSKVKDEIISTDVTGKELATDSNTTTTIPAKKRYVTPQDFELLKVIGMGAFGKVLQVRNKKNKQILAMKVISKRLLKRKSSYVENIHAERDILTKIRHPFIVNMHCSFQTKEKLFIIMDFLAGGELFLRLGREGIFLESTAKFYVAEIVLALEHLHSKGILHRDLKPENILLASDGHLCLTDFGLAKDFHWEGSDQEREDGRALTICGTQEYMAPEMVAKQGYTKAADWWSLGCIAYEMLAGEPPFQSKKGAKDLFRKIMNERIRMPDGSSSAACKLLKGLLNRNASARLGAAKGTMFQVGGTAQVKQLEFFAGLDWMLLERKEIDPPLSASVEGEDDLRHFYDEFTNMQLPRSVKEMAKDDFKPRQCRSDVFKGFSFIQHDFPLPDRTVDQDEHYWNNVDEDGESASECASIFGGEETEKNKETLQPTLEPTPEVATTATKKKRPPRKKKKKDQIDDENDDDKVDADNHEDKSTTSATPEKVKINSDTSPPTTSTIVEDDPIKNSFPPKDTETNDHKVMNKETVVSRLSKLTPDNNNSIQSSRPKAPVWETVGTSKEKHKMVDSKKDTTPSQSKLSIHSKQFVPATHLASQSNITASSNITPKLPASTATKPTFPGQWAKHSLTPQTTASKPSIAPTTKRLTSDWRDHKLQPKSVLKPELKQQPIISDEKEFPSLNDFPTLGSQNKKTGSNTNPIPQGPWAKLNAQVPRSTMKEGASGPWRKI
jgi:p70 ribosomal S6 kinase